MLGNTQATNHEQDFIDYLKSDNFDEDLTQLMTEDFNVIADDDIWPFYFDAVDEKVVRKASLGRTGFRVAIAPQRTQSIADLLDDRNNLPEIISFLKGRLKTRFMSTIAEHQKNLVKLDDDDIYGGYIEHQFFLDELPSDALFTATNSWYRDVDVNLINEWDLKEKVFVSVMQRTRTPHLFSIDSQFMRNLVTGKDFIDRSLPIFYHLTTESLKTLAEEDKIPEGFDAKELANARASFEKVPDDFWKNSEYVEVLALIQKLDPRAAQELNNEHPAYVDIRNHSNYLDGLSKNSDVKKLVLSMTENDFYHYIDGGITDLDHFFEEKPCDYEIRLTQGQFNLLEKVIDTQQAMGEYFTDKTSYIYQDFKLDPVVLDMFSHVVVM